MIDVRTPDPLTSELSAGMALTKCRQCGCMQDALSAMREALAANATAGETALRGQIHGWLGEMQAVKYACLGCEHCYAGAATNLFAEAFPEAADGLVLSCTFEVRAGGWPVVPGEYLVVDGRTGSVAVSTLASLDLPEQVVALRPAGLAIAGKTETENIGLDKVIKNTIGNPGLRYLILAGRESHGHQSGQTLLALSQNGVDERLRVIGSQGKRPVLRNVSRQEIEAFRQQVQIVDMIGCEDPAAIAARVSELAGRSSDSCNDPTCACHGQPVFQPSFSIPLTFAPVTSSCGCDEACLELGSSSSGSVSVTQARAPAHVELDKAGYFVVLVQRDRGVIIAEHYTYDNTLNGVIEGQDARDIYWTAIEHAWVSELSHAAYLGKELAKAEAALKSGGKYMQDGA